MKASPLNPTQAQNRVGTAQKESAAPDQPAVKSSVTGRLIARVGELLISAGTHLKNRSHQERLQDARTQRQFDVIKII